MIKKPQHLRIRYPTAVAGALFLVIWATTAQGQTSSLSGRVMRITGPNQVIVEGPGGAQYQVRLQGTSAAGLDAAASYAQERLTSDLLGRHVTVDNISGNANQLKGVVSYGHEDINHRWVSEGMLRYDEEDSKKDRADAYRAAETEARLSERGIWRQMETSNPEPAPEPPHQPTEVLEPPPGGWKFRPTNTYPATH